MIAELQEQITTNKAYHTQNRENITKLDNKLKQIIRNM